ncbi:MAG: sugar phosphate isomerase/epimerase [Firmicutes bacterium]|nr:sugar phosphate isomerase/epimerase [Bacillota bacterium]
MKIGVSMWSLQKKFFKGTLTVEEFIAYASSAGVEGVELLDCFWRNEAEELVKTPGLLGKYRLAPAAYAVGNDFVDPDPAKRAAQLDYVRRGVDVAKQLGAPVLRVFSGNAKEGIAFETAREWIIEGLRRSAEYAQEHRIVLALENHGLFAGRSQQVREILETVNSPYLRATIDTANFFLVGENPAEAAEALARYAAHVHLKDFYKVGPDFAKEAYKGVAGDRYTGIAAGKGEVDFPRIFRALRKAGYGGFLSIEFEGNEDPEQGVAESVAYLSRIL